MKYEIIHAILSLRPGAEVSIVDNSLSGITWHDTKQSQPSDSEINAEIVRLDAAEPMRLLRLERDKRLTETDWMTNSDAPTMSTAWKNYRQALRDLPASADPKLDSNDDLTNVTWPTKP